MSKGLGKMEQAVLATVEEHSDPYILSNKVAHFVADKMPKEKTTYSLGWRSYRSNAFSASVSRAVSSLLRKGYLINYNGHSTALAYKR